jgi:hypothetical protein
MDAHLVYDGTNLTMTLTDTVTKATVTEVFPVNIPSLIGSSTAYVGFTGGTGGATATQNVLSWTYSGPTGQTGTTTGSTPATPKFSPSSGTYSASQSVTISEATTGATIYYTTNGTTPTSSSTKYLGAIKVSGSETLEAIAVASGGSKSPVATAAYTISSSTAALSTPVFSPAGGTYTNKQSVTISDASAGATIYYTTNGTAPTTASTKYSGAISVSASEKLEAIAVASGHTNSPVATASYTISTALPAPSFSVAPGVYLTSQSVKISDSAPGTTIYYTINGTTPTTDSTQYSSAILVSRTETLEAIAVATGHANSPTTTASYTISPSSGAVAQRVPMSVISAK